jgi:Leucine Rich Repeat
MTSFKRTNFQLTKPCFFFLDSTFPNWKIPSKKKNQKIGKKKKPRKTGEKNMKIVIKASIVCAAILLCSVAAMAQQVDEDSANKMRIEEHSGTVVALKNRKAASVNSTSVSPIERRALLDIYSATGGRFWWNTNYGWDTASVDECNWYGVRCSSPTSGSAHVIGLRLSMNGLNGYLPGTIGDLFALTELHMSNNMLDWQLPSALSTLKFLSVVDLSLNDFTGVLPYEYSELTQYSLSLLNVTQNSLGGSLGGYQWIGQAQQRGVKFDLSGNPFDCPLPSFAIAAGASCVQRLNLTDVQPSCASSDQLVVVYGGEWPKDQQLYCYFGNFSSQPAEVASSTVLTCVTPDFSRFDDEYADLGLSIRNERRTQLTDTLFFRAVGDPDRIPEYCFGDGEDSSTWEDDSSSSWWEDDDDSSSSSSWWESSSSSSWWESSSSSSWWESSSSSSWWESSSSSSWSEEGSSWWSDASSSSSLSSFTSVCMSLVLLIAILF